MKYNYTFLLRPAVLCLAVLWLAVSANLALAQSRANVTPVQTGGASSYTTRNTPAQPLAGAEIVVSPSALSDTLNTGKQNTQQLTVENTGTDTLVFYAGTIPHFPPPNNGRIRVLMIPDYEPYASQVPLLFAKSPDIQLFVFQYWNMTINLATLQQYDVVMVGNGNPTTYRDVLGNVLADYVDAGGKVILTANTFGDFPLTLGGRFFDDHYSPVLPATGGNGGTLTLGTVAEPTHPIIQGVSNLSNARGAYTLQTTPGATDIAYYNNGDLLVATNPHVAAVNINLMWDNHNEIRYWSGDFDVLFSNVVRYLQASKVISVNPNRGAIAPGSQAVLDVTFNAAGLNAGTYQADLQVSSNATNPLITVPLTLVSIGNEILFQPDTVKAALHKAQTAVRTLAITNNSPDDHTFTISGVPSYITVSPTSGNLPSGASDTLTVTFSSAALEYGTYTTPITFNVDGVTWKASTSFYVFDDPALDVSVTGLHDTVAYKQESVQTFEIHNTGGSTLTYSLQFQETTALARQNFIASVPLLEEDFEGAVFPPQGWTAPLSNGYSWRANTEFVRNNAGYYDNYAGSGKAATIADDFTLGAFWQNSVALETPAISTAGYNNFSVEYKANFQENPLSDSLTLEVQVDNGAWQPVLVWSWDANGTHGGYFAAPGEAVSVSLAQYVDTTATSFRVRWRYAAYATMEAYWYGQIDDVVVYGERRQWLNVIPETASIAPGESATLTANFSAAELEPGYYTGRLLISSNDPLQPIDTIPASLYVNETALVISEQSIVATVVAGDTVARSLVLTNQGGVAVDYTFSQTSPGVAPEAVLYGTDFDEFASGDLNGQQGWVSYSNLAQVVADGDGKHVFCAGGGLNMASLKSPVTTLGTHNITSLRIDITQATTTPYFNIAASSVAGGRLLGITFNSTNIVVDGYDTAGHYYSTNLSIPPHGAALNVRVDADRATNTFIVYFNGSPIFTGATTHGDIQWTNIYASNVYIESFSLSNQDAAPEYGRSVSPVSGIIQPGQSQTVTITFDPRNTTTGTYHDVLTVTSETLGNATNIPVTLTVVEDTTVARPESLAVRAAASEETAGESITLYPVPVLDDLHIKLPAGEKGTVRVLIHDVQGKAVYTKDGDAATFRNYTINTQDAGLPTGFYYIQVQYANGKREMRKFVKK